MPKTTTLYKGDVQRRVGTERERRQLLASGWSESAPEKASGSSQRSTEPEPAPQPTPPAVKPQSKNESK